MWGGLCSYQKVSVRNELSLIYSYFGSVYYSIESCVHYFSCQKREVNVQNLKPAMLQLPHIMSNSKPKETPNMV